MNYEILNFTVPECSEKFQFVQELLHFSGDKTPTASFLVPLRFLLLHNLKLS